MKAPKVRWEIGEASSTLPVATVRSDAQVEFERLLSESGMPTWLSGDREFDGFETTDKGPAESLEGSRVGRKIAKAIYGGPRR